MFSLISVTAALLESLQNALVRYFYGHRETFWNDTRGHIQPTTPLSSSIFSESNQVIHALRLCLPFGNAVAECKAERETCTFIHLPLFFASLLLLIFVPPLPFYFFYPFLTSPFLISRSLNLSLYGFLRIGCYDTRVWQSPAKYESWPCAREWEMTGA